MKKLTNICLIVLMSVVIILVITFMNNKKSTDNKFYDEINYKSDNKASIKDDRLEILKKEVKAGAYYTKNNASWLQINEDKTCMLVLYTNIKDSAITYEGRYIIDKDNLIISGFSEIECEFVINDENMLIFKNADDNISKFTGKSAEYYLASDNYSVNNYSLNNEEKEVKAGKYYSPNKMSVLEINEDGTFEFIRGVVNWVFRGSYTVENDKLIINDISTGEYEFKIADDEMLVFQKGNKYTEFIPEGTRYCFEK